MSFQAAENSTNSDSNDDMDYGFIKIETIIEPHLLESFTDDSETTHQRRTRSVKIEKAFFCTLCLRKCAPESLLEFSFHMNLNSADISAAERKVQQALGLVLKLENRAICHTCWKLVQMIMDFKECCTKAASKLEQYPLGLAHDGEWTSDGTLSGIDQVHKAIWDHAWKIDTHQGQVVEENLDTSFPSVGDDDSRDQVPNDMMEKTKGSSKKLTKRQKPVSKKDLAANNDEDSSSRVQDDNEEQPTANDCGRIKPTEPIELDEDHYQVKIASCGICNRNFDGKIALRLHQTRCTAENPSTKSYFSCPICTASFLENSGLVFHLNKHKGIRPFKCRKFCDRTYASNFTRIKHERRYCEQDGRICSICGATLKNEASLLGHMQSVHGEAKYSCNICGRKFRCSNICNDHKRVHSDERKYICKVCNKAYKSPFALKTHARLHTSERPYACHLCEQAFNYKVLLKTHIERYHGSNNIG